MDTVSVTNEQIAQRISALCQRLQEAQVDAYLVPSADSHLNEYVSVHQQRRAAISNFSGSAGDALISPHGSHVFVDAIYICLKPDITLSDSFGVQFVAACD